VLRLQQIAGNRAVGGLLAREPVVTADELHDLEQREDLKRKIVDMYGDIVDLRKDMITTWESNARVEDPPSRLHQFIVGALGIVIAIVSEGVGGVVYSVVSDAMKPSKLPHLVKEFVDLGALEAGDVAAEGPLKWALSMAEHDLVGGINGAKDKIKDTFKDEAVQKIVDASRGDVISVYTAAMRRQVHVENDATKDEFNGRAATMTLKELRELYAGQRIIHDLLLQAPQDYLTQLTRGYMSMIDKAQHARRRKDASAEEVVDEDADRTVLSAGILELAADEPGSSEHHLIGTWDSPDLNFPSFDFGVYGLNQALLKDLVGLTPAQLPGTTIRVALRAKNAYSGWFVYEQIAIRFVIDDKGEIHVTTFGDAREWLASYYDHLSREHSDEERARLAPLGARKLWDRIKDRPLR
jgi:hypothetical protein